MNLVVVSDHAGYYLKDGIKKYLEELGHKVIDCGTDSPESVDYPDFADKAVQEILEGRAERGVFICGTGIGISIAANRHKGIRAALCSDIYSVRLSRQHNDSNVLAMGAGIVALPLAKELVREWLQTEFEGGRHERRVCKLDLNK